MKNYLNMEICKARTEKNCRVCFKNIKEKQQFVRIGIFPKDMTIHYKCIDSFVEKLEELNLE